MCCKSDWPFNEMSHTNKYQISSNWPKISIVTPSFNQGEFLEETIKSVLSQNYPNLEYFIIDGGSTDNSVDVIKKYEKHLTYWETKPDNGMYHAIKKGFDLSTGEVMGWINSDDKIHPNSLSILGEVFNSFPKIEWLTGTPSTLDKYGRVVWVNSYLKWSKYSFLVDEYHPSIQQESTFWRKSLWEKAQGFSLDYQYAGDFELWMRFFNYAELYRISTILGGFRFRGSDQISIGRIDDYRKEKKEIIKNFRATVSRKNKIKVSVIKFLESLNKLFKKITGFYFLDSVLEKLYVYPGNIIYMDNKWQYRYTYRPRN